MSETYISLYGEKCEAFERVKEDLGPDGVTPSNAAVVMRLIEFYEAQDESGDALEGGLMR
jgi:hypothetical protein